MKLKNIHWYLRRLGSMSFPELVYRVQQKAAVELDRRRPQAYQTFYSPFAIDEYWRVFKAGQEPTFFFRESDRDSFVESYGAYFGAEYEAAIQTADALTQHQLCLFGQQLDLGEQIVWQSDPLTKRLWPNTFFADIDIRDGKTVGGVKWVWELNRHHHLVTLGKAYFLTQEERYAQEVCHQLKSWIETNPPLMGVNWTSSLELALRLINWTWALYFVQASPHLTKELFAQMMQSITAQAHYITRHLSAYSSANNHLIGEASGLAVVGLCFPWLPLADQWRQRGVTILERELEKQIYADGVTAEQAVAYLTFVLDFVLIVWRLLEINNLNVPPIWPQRLEAACEFIQCLMDEQGHLPAIGDDDDAWVVRLDDRRQVNRYQPLLAAGAVLLSRPAFKAGAGRWDEKSQWLWGQKGQSTYESLPAFDGAIDSHVFAQGGYVVMRQTHCVLTFDCGPLGYLATAAHGHADALSLTLSLHGVPILIDPGTYAYQEGQEWRDYFRGTSAHNTLLVDGRNQSDLQGAFLWGQRAVTRLVHWQLTADYDFAVAEQSGYVKTGVTHRRSVLFYKPYGVLVVDDCQGNNTHSVDQLWHVPAHSQVTLKDNYVKVDAGPVPLYVMPVEHLVNMKTAVLFGERSPIQGWASSHYGHIEPSPVISFSGQVDLPQRLMTILCWAELPDLDRVRKMKNLFNSLEAEVKH